MTLKDAVREDDFVFFDSEELGETHRIEGVPITCVICSDSRGRDTKHEEGLREIMIYMPVKECEDAGIGPMEEGQGINIDGSEYMITEWTHEMGIYAVRMSRYGGI